MSMKEATPKMILIFIAGLIIGAVIVWLLYSRCNITNGNNGDEDKGGSDPVIIDTTTSQNYFSNYLHFPVSVDSVKALVINKQQYDAMTQILALYPDLKGFRIYFGATDTTINYNKMMVVGFGSPDYYQTIYATDSEESGLCPFICDDKSPVTGDGH